LKASMPSARRAASRRATSGTHFRGTNSKHCQLWQARLHCRCQPRRATLSRSFHGISWRAKRSSAELLLSAC
jgi:hypothetical protein